jgi:hypothetical protein
MADTPEKATPAKATAPAADAEKATVLDPAFVKKHNLPEDYVQAVESGATSPPPVLGEDHDGSTEQHFAAGSWFITKKGQKPGESTAISR